MKWISSFLKQSPKHYLLSCPARCHSSVHQLYISSWIENTSLPDGVLPDAHVSSCTGKSAASSGELWASTRKSGIYQELYRSWRSHPGWHEEKAEPIQICFLVTGRQSLKVCRLKANNEKLNEGCSVSVSSLGIRQLWERNYMHWAQRCLIPFLLQKEMFSRGKDELQQDSHTLPHGMTALWEPWPC